MFYSSYVLVFSFIYLTNIWVPVGSQHTYPTRSDVISIPGDAVYARRGDHGRAKHERVSLEMQYGAMFLIFIREDIAKYDKLKKNYEDPTYEIVSSVFRALAGKKIIGSRSFPRQRSVHLHSN